MSWLISNALMNSLSLQGLAVESLEDTSLDGEQSALSSGKPTPQAYLSPDKMTEFSRLSRFGMTFKPLTDDLGEGLSMSSVVAFHVRTLVPLEKGQELMESEAECGEKWRASFTKYDLDSCSWKTHQCSLLGDLDEFSETWPQWGLMRDGECWEQRTLEQTIRGTGFGSLQNKWATPTTMDKLPPKSEKSLNREATITRPNRTKPSNLRDQVSNMKYWPTPDANCGMRGTQELWTPKRKSGHQAQYSINQAVRDAEKIRWPTPVKSDHAARRPSKGWQGNSDLPSVVWTETGGRENPNLSPAQLNATWVEWLMGWPLGWTDLKPLEMGKFPCVRQPHGES